LYLKERRFLSGIGFSLEPKMFAGGESKPKPPGEGS
jgi:hypothetical protein